MPRPRRNPRISLQLPAEAAAFIASLEPILQPNSCRAYAQGLRRLNAFLQSEGLAIGDITRQRIVEWSKDLHREGLSAATRTLALIAARSYFRYLHEAGLLATDARQLVTNSDLPKLPRTLPRSLQPETDRQLCELWESSTRPTWLGLLLLRQTGMRVGELQALPYDCIHEVAHARRYIKVPVGKLRSERVVPIDDAVMATVSRLQASRPGKRRWLVPSPSGRQISYRAFQRALRDAVDVLGVTDSQPLTIHRLRHTYGTAMLNAGMSLSVLKEILGHRDIAMTLRYATPTLELLSGQYDCAIATMMERYASCARRLTTESTSASTLLDSLSRLVERGARDSSPSAQRQARGIVKRLQRIERRLVELGLDSS